MIPHEVRLSDAELGTLSGARLDKWKAALATGDRQRLIDAHYELFQEPSPGFAEAPGVGDVGPRVAPRHGFPAPMGAAAYYGLVGDVVRAIEPQTEADPHAILVQALVAFGNVIGRGPRFAVEADEHPTALFALVVGESSKARKGTSVGYIRRTIQTADSDYVERRVVGGLSSGEGLVWAVRDATTKMVKPKRKDGEEESAFDDWIEETTDPGIDDKRLLVIESEFAQALKVMARPGNTLSPALRGLWDHGTAGMLTKHDPTKATNAHVSLIGHITRDELRRLMDATEQANGFANRFLFCCARRSKLLPHGGDFQLDTSLAFELSNAVKVADAVGRNGRLKRDAAADSLWEREYPALSEGAPGLLGAITSRAEAQVMRVALLYAVLDGSSSVSQQHLAAALEVWRYCEASARYVFGDATGDAVADEILTALRAAGEAGMSRTEIRDLFSRHRGDRVGGALAALAAAGLAVSSNETTPGRPVQRWVATKATKATKAPGDDPYVA